MASNVVRLADPRSVARASVGRKLNRSEAEALTLQIRTAAGTLWQLVAEAHDRKAWQALGYETWKDYVKTELQMSESRAFQIVDQGKVMRAIGEVAGDPEVLGAVQLTARETARIKPHLSTFKQELKKALKDDFPIQEAVAEAIYSLPSRDVEHKVIDGEVVIPSSAKEAHDKLAAKQDAFLKALEEEQAAGKKGKSSVKPIDFTTKTCPTCSGTGTVPV